VIRVCTHKPIQMAPNGEIRRISLSRRQRTVHRNNSDDNRGNAGFLDLGGSNFGRGLGDGARSRGRALGGGLGAKPPEAEETLQIVHVRKVFCVSRVVSKRALLFLYTNLYTKCRSINILRVYQCFMERGVIVKFSPRICIDLHGCP